MIGIYKITNPIGEIYVGQSIDIEKRFKSYESLQCQSQRKIYDSLCKYGYNNHTFDIVEECLEEDLVFYEKYWISKLQCYSKGLNLKPKNDFVSSTDKSKKSKSITVNFKNHIFDKLESHCKLYYIKPTDFIRYSVNKALEAEEKSLATINRNDILQGSFNLVNHLGFKIDSYDQLFEEKIYMEIMTTYLKSLLTQTKNPLNKIIMEKMLNELEININSESALIKHMLATEINSTK